MRMNEGKAEGRVWRYYVSFGIIVVVLFMHLIRVNKYYYVRVNEDNEFGHLVCFNKHVGPAFLYSVPEYVISDGTLYLYVQKITSNALRIVEIEFARWDIAKLTAFRKANPELEEYWPDRSKKSAGVPWIMEAEEL